MEEPCYWIGVMMRRLGLSVSMSISALFLAFWSYTEGRKIDVGGSRRGIGLVVGHKHTGCHLQRE